MKIPSYIILILLFFCSCNYNKNGEANSQNIIPIDTVKQESTTPLKDKASEDSIIAFNINGFQQLSFKFNVDPTGQLLKNIKVYANNKLFQIIKANKEIEIKRFELIDYNFDGYKDISVLANFGSGGCTYWIWNYSKPDKKFYFNKELSGMFGLEIDTASRFIVNHYREGYAHEFWDTSKYRNNKLIFVKGLEIERYNDLKGDFWEKKTHKKVIKNKLITRIDSAILKK